MTRHVAEAYSTNDKNNNLKKYSFWAISFIAFLVFSVGSSGSSGQNKKQKRAQKLRNKAETMPEVEVQKQQNIIEKVELNEKYAQLNDAHAAFEDDEDAYLINSVMDEEDLDREVERAFSGVDMAEEDEIDSNNSILTTAMQSMEESVKLYLGKVFGYGDDDDDDDDDAAAMAEASADLHLSEKQLDAITKKIADRLERDVKTEFRARADSVREEKERQISGVLAEDKKARMNTREIVDDVHEAQAVVVEDLKDEIDEAARGVKDSLPEKVKKIRNEVVMEVTGKKLDDIEQKKRARKEKKTEIRKKFQEMQVKGRESAAKDTRLKAKSKKHKYSKPGELERGREYKPESYGEKYAVKKNKIHRTFKSKQPKQSKPRVDESPRRPKPFSEEDKLIARKKNNQNISREKSEGSEDEDKKSEASKDEDEISVSSERGDKYASEDE